MYNPFSVQPRSVGDFLRDPNRYQGSPAVVASQTPSLFNIDVSKVSPFVENLSESHNDIPILETSVKSNPEAYSDVCESSGLGFSYILCIILLFIIFLGLGTIFGYLYKKSNQISTETSTQTLEHLPTQLPVQEAVVERNIIPIPS